MLPFPPLSVSSQESCTNHRTQREGVSSKKLLLLLLWLLCATCLFLGSTWKPHSRSPVLGRRELSVRAAASWYCCSLPLKTSPKHTFLLSSISLVAKYFFFSFLKHWSRQRKFKSLSFHLQCRFWIRYSVSLNFFPQPWWLDFLSRFNESQHFNLISQEQQLELQGYL